MTTPANPPWNPLGFKGYPPDGRKLTEEEPEACRAVRLDTKEAVIGFALLNGWTLVADKAPNPAEKGEIWFKRGNDMMVKYWHEEEVARRKKVAEEYLRRLTEGVNTGQAVDRRTKHSLKPRLQR